MMKTVVKIVSVLVLAGGALWWFASTRTASQQKREAAVEPQQRGEASVTTRAARSVPARSVTTFRTTTPAVVADAPKTLPLNHDDIPMTPELQKGFAGLEREYGPMFLARLDGELSRRAQLATCGINDVGALVVEIHYSTDPDGKTMTANEVKIDKMGNSFQGAVADKAKECVQNAILHETVPFDRRGPRGLLMDPDEALVYDIVKFPVETDELYEFLQTGALASYHAMETKQTYGLLN
jgi:hypothetical protein